jgi:hypothetical protein
MRGLPRRLKTAPAKSYLIFHAAMPASDTISRVFEQRYFPRRVLNIVRGCTPRRQITRAMPLPIESDHPVRHNHAALGRRSFLKKRTKRLLFFGAILDLWPMASTFRRRMSKGLLVLFFRKEHSSSSMP